MSKYISTKITVHDHRGETINVVLDYPPDSCPYCRTRGEQERLGNGYYSRYDKTTAPIVKVLFRCYFASCREVFIACFYPASADVIKAFNEEILTKRNDLKVVFLRTLPKFFEPLSFSPELRALSPNYCKIFQEAHDAEESGLLEIAGPGYRRALEFLLKDFLRHTNPSEEVAIRAQSSLVGLIRQYIQNPRLIQIAERTAWIGNDETHYDRKHSEMDLDDLKVLLRLTASLIEDDVVGRRYIDRMTHKK